MLKKIVCIILAIACMLPFASCKKEEFYPEIPSTEEESRVVFSFKLDDEVYEVVCPACNDVIYLDAEMLADEGIDCPNCGTALEFDFDCCDDDCCCGCHDEEDGE